MNELIWQFIVVALLVLAVAEGLVLLAVMRQMGAIQLQIGPAHAGEVEGGPDEGTQVEVPGLAAGKPAILAFVSPGCRACEGVVPAIAALRRDFPEVETIAVIGPGDASERIEYAAQYGDAARLDLRYLFDSLEIPYTPYTLALDPDSKVVLKGVVNNLPHLESVATVLLGHDDDHHDHDDHDHVHADEEHSIELELAGAAPASEAASNGRVREPSS